MLKRSPTLHCDRTHSSVFGSDTAGNVDACTYAGIVGSAQAPGSSAQRCPGSQHRTGVRLLQEVAYVSRLLLQRQGHCQPRHATSISSTTIDSVVSATSVSQCWACAMTRRFRGPGV